MRDDDEDALTRQLRAAVRDLPADKVAEVLDSAGYLRDKYGQARPERGSAEAIFRALDEVGPLEFEPGELETLLAEIERLRDSDLEEHG